MTSTKTSTKTRRVSTGRSAPRQRSQSGAILPFLIFCVLVIAAFLALAIDIMRNVKAVNGLSFAAESAALHAFSLSTDSNGNYTPVDAENRMRLALQTSGGNSDTAWNRALRGPADDRSAPCNSGVTFALGDGRFVTNPADNSEVWLQVTARRQGADALRMMFLPMLLAMNALNGEQLPQHVYRVEPWRTCEVIAQPASRIGAGAPRTGGGGRSVELAGHAVVPIGITLREFQLLSAPTETRARYQVDLQASALPLFGQPAAAGHLKGYFVNVTATGGSNYYGDGSGSLALDQLIGNLNYFGIGTAIAPAVVERGGRLAWFDQSDPAVQQRKPQILAALQHLPARPYIFPVLRSDPQVGVRNEVVGFARLRLVQAVNATATDYNIVVDVAESVPVRNASSATGTASVPPLTATVLPAPVAPFLPRRLTSGADALEVRMRGVAMAPAISPRLIMSQ